MLSDSGKSYKILGYLQVGVCLSENSPPRILSMDIWMQCFCFYLLYSDCGTKKPGLRLRAQYPTSDCRTYCVT